MSSRKELANAIRALSMDAVQKAKSGHPGAPMGMADIAEVLWRDFLKHNPQNPSWADRDRFVLSNGHGSMLIYSLLHLTGYDLPMEELKNFRQLHSKTPGHPEVGYTAGVETTTGPLGQGIANAVGMAIAEKTLAAQFNRPGHDIVDHYTYAFMGDGCMMEGISHEVCSLAGTLKLGKLIAFYDDNGISIDGHVEGWFTDDTAMRFEAYGWHVIRDIDGHDAASIKRAVEEARAVTDKPSLLMCKTIIGFGSPNKAGTHDSHGAPLGDAEIALTREQLGWKYAPFEIPSEIYAQWDAKEAGQAKESAWNEKFAAYAKAYPQEAAEFTRRMPFDMATSGRAGGRHGPAAIRQVSTNLAWEHNRFPWNFDMRERLNVVDCGDLVYAFGDAREMSEKLQAHAEKLLAAGKRMLSFGGDHFVTLPLLRAHAKHFGKMALVHFDAHTDTYANGCEFDHGTMFYTAPNEGLIDPNHSVQIGIRTEFDKDNGFTVLDAGQVNDRSVDDVIAQVKQIVGDMPVYLTFDIDCLDPAFAPGTGTPVIGGLTSDRAIKLVRGLKDLNIVGMDVVEVAPAYDQSEITALAAATLALEMLYIQAAKKGE